MPDDDDDNLETNRPPAPDDHADAETNRPPAGNGEAPAIDARELDPAAEPRPITEPPVSEEIATLPPVAAAAAAALSQPGALRPPPVPTDVDLDAGAGEELSGGSRDSSS